MRTNNAKLLITAQGYKPSEAILLMEQADGSLTIWQGHHRLQAVKELGYSQIPARIVHYFGD